MVPKSSSIFTLSSTLVYYLFDSGHLSGCEIISHCGFDFHFSDAEYSFIFLLAICMPSLEKSLFRSFKNSVICLFCYWVVVFFFGEKIFLLAVVGVHCCTWTFSSCGEHGLFSSWVHKLLVVVASLVEELWLSDLRSCGSCVLEHGLSSCGPQVKLPCDRWDLPRPVIEPLFPALAGRFLTTGLPGKSSTGGFKRQAVGSCCFFPVLLRRAWGVPSQVPGFLLPTTKKSECHIQQL